MEKRKGMRRRDEEKKKEEDGWGRRKGSRVKA